MALPPTRQYGRETATDYLLSRLLARALIFCKLFRESARISVGEHEGKGLLRSTKIAREEGRWRKKRRKRNEREAERVLGYSRLCHGSCRDSRCIISHRSFS